MGRVGLTDWKLYTQRGRKNFFFKVTENSSKCLVRLVLKLKVITTTTTKGSKLEQERWIICRGPVVNKYLFTKLKSGTRLQV